MVTGQENIPGRKPSSNVERSLVGKGVGEVGSARAGGLRHAVGAWGADAEMLGTRTPSISTC